MIARCAAVALLGALACAPPRTDPVVAEVRISVRDEDGDLPLLAHVELGRVDGVVMSTKTVDLRGDASVTLTPGRYRVTASHGLEWTIDKRVVDLGGRTDVALRLRHVVRSDVLVPCELRADADGSTPDARLRALASAGFRFAVARERESVADYAAAASRTNLGSVVVFAPAAAVSPPRGPTSLGTYADIGGWLGGWEQGYSGAPLDPSVVLQSLHDGRSFVTNGPILEVDVDGAHIGEPLVWRSHVDAHVRVRAAAWVDVTSLEILADGALLRREAVASTTQSIRVDATLPLTLANGAPALSFIVRGKVPFAAGAPGEGTLPFAEGALPIGAGPLQ